MHAFVPLQLLIPSMKGLFLYLLHFHAAKTGGTETTSTNIATEEAGLSGHAITATFPKTPLGSENEEQSIAAAPTMGS